MNEKAILDKLFAASEEDNIPQKTVGISRIGLSFTLQGLKEDKLEKLQKQYTNIEKVRGEEIEKLDRKRYNRAVIAEATIAIGDDKNVRWNHPELLSKYRASGAEQVIKRVLLSGEIMQLVDIVMDLSGFYNSTKEIDQIKNLSEGDE
ncbi:Phage XkdN-like tail assembly chaperone protein, TAC [Desulfotomaculum arcticum]|uniref:Phage XkdN-like tail assembly chaperone protein, TAC n=1 Tax=Desulfotruncus arcticus DSM 17038 TaxID=1121424 RepID=A0A1I2Y889_9FIRM|nr:hypothetical protein [Desulfotruncus arcticus]SFH21166.1 Phage XkdN-like tail assembly chaperone protein, TAC [Desulfotomaculum arcticum] [Desulfotruncus arcticus DSM 17038]